MNSNKLINFQKCAVSQLSGMTVDEVSLLVHKLLNDDSTALSHLLDNIIYNEVASNFDFYQSELSDYWSRYINAEGSSRHVCLQDVLEQGLSLCYFIEGDFSDETNTLQFIKSLPENYEPDFTHLQVMAIDKFSDFLVDLDHPSENIIFDWEKRILYIKDKNSNLINIYHLERIFLSKDFRKNIRELSELFLREFKNIISN